MPTFKLTFNLDNSPKDIDIEAIGFVAAGDEATIAIKSPSGNYIYNNLGGAVADLTGAAATSTSIANLPLDTDSEVETGTYTVEYEYTPAVGAPSSGSYTYFYCDSILPTLDTTTVSSCNTSIMTSTDSSTYTTTCNGETLSPTSKSLAWVIKYPTTMTTIPADETGTGTSITVGPNIWTGEYSIRLTVTYTYETSDGLIVSNVETRIETHEVACSDCQCQMLLCIKSLTDKWITYSTTSPRKAEELNEVLTVFGRLYDIYQVANACGNETIQNEICSEIKTLISSTADCCDVTDADQTSVEVIPVASGSGSGSTAATEIHFGSYPTTVSAAIGADGDMAIDTSGTGRYYKKITGAWVFQVSVNGSTGAAGAAGAAGADGADGTTVFSNATTLVTKTAPASGAMYSQALSTAYTDGSKVGVTMRYQIPDTVSGKIDFYIDATIFATYTFALSKQKNIILEAEIIRVSATVAHVITKIYYSEGTGVSSGAIVLPQHKIVAVADFNAMTISDDVTITAGTADYYGQNFNIEDKIK